MQFLAFRISCSFNVNLADFGLKTSLVIQVVVSLSLPMSGIRIMELHLPVVSVIMNIFWILFQKQFLLRRRKNLVVSVQTGRLRENRLTVSPWTPVLHGPGLWMTSHQAFPLSFRFTFFYFHIFIFRNNLVTICNTHSLFVIITDVLKMWVLQQWFILFG